MAKLNLFKREQPGWSLKAWPRDLKLILTQRNKHSNRCYKEQTKKCHMLQMKPPQVVSLLVWIDSGWQDTIHFQKRESNWVIIEWTQYLYRYCLYLPCREPIIFAWRESEAKIQVCTSQDHVVICMGDDLIILECFSCLSCANYSHYSDFLYYLYRFVLPVITIFQIKRSKNTAPRLQNNHDPLPANNMM